MSLMREMGSRTGGTAIIRQDLLVATLWAATSTGIGNINIQEDIDKLNRMYHHSASSPSRIMLENDPLGPYPDVVFEPDTLAPRTVAQLAAEQRQFIDDRQIQAVDIDVPEDDGWTR